MKKKLLLRLGMDVYNDVVKSAKENDRSINAEIINLLKKSLK